MVTEQGTFLGDDDAETNGLNLEPKQNSFSTVRNKTLKLVSTITGSHRASRRKLFYEIQSNSDIKIWTVLHEERSVKCVKVFNPAILMDKSSEYLKSIKFAHRLEVEDPEGAMTTVPKHLDTGNLEMMLVTWSRVRNLPKKCYHSKLKYLDLQRNSIRGFKGVEKAVNLEVLNISHNLIHRLPKHFMALKYLKDLNVSSNFLTALPEFLPILHHLRNLDCSNNQLRRLPPNLGLTVSLRTLDVSSNQISDLPFSIGQLTALVDFRASSNHISHLPKSFGNLEKLKCLNLRKNKFFKTPAELKGLSSLQYLNLRDNSLSDFAYVVPSLKYLILDSNLLKDISQKLLECSKLETLSLQFNRISSIPPSIHQLTSLKLLYLCHNPLPTLPDSLALMGQLKQLHLSHTPLTTLPPALRNMTNLTHVTIDDCPNIDMYLKLEYKSAGIEGIKAYLKENLNNLSPNGGEIEVCVTNDGEIITGVYNCGNHGRNLGLETNNVVITITDVNGDTVNLEDTITDTATTKHIDSTNEDEADSKSPKCSIEDLNEDRKRDLKRENASITEPEGPIVRVSAQYSVVNRTKHMSIYPTVSSLGSCPVAGEDDAVGRTPLLVMGAQVRSIILTSDQRNIFVKL